MKPSIIWCRKSEAGWTTGVRPPVIRSRRNRITQHRAHHMLAERTPTRPCMATTLAQGSRAVRAHLVPFAPLCGHGSSYSNCYLLVPQSRQWIYFRRPDGGDQAGQSSQPEHAADGSGKARRIVDADSIEHAAMLPRNQIQGLLH